LTKCIVIANLEQMLKPIEYLCRSKKLNVKIATLVKAASLYYEYNYNQQQIAKKLNISRPGVSRLLQQARNAGIVKIEIIDPEKKGTALENKIAQQFHLKKVIIVPNSGSDNYTITKNLGLAAAKFFDELVTDNMILGISWGTTMLEIKNQIIPKIIKNMIVVQLNGGVSRAEYNTHASEVTQKIGESYHAIPYLLPLPAIVDNAELKNAIISDKNIMKTFDLAKKADVAIFTIGSFDHDSVLVKSEYFNREEVDDLLNKGAVGNVCSRIITYDGEICSEELNSRTIGLDLEEIKSKKYSIAVAGGQKKFSAIKAALKGKLFNTLITDEEVAKKLLQN